MDKIVIGKSFPRSYLRVKTFYPRKTKGATERRVAAAAVHRKKWAAVSTASGLKGDAKIVI